MVHSTVETWKIKLLNKIAKKSQVWALELKLGVDIRMNSEFI